VIGAYGSGALPRIQADGLSADAVRLADEQHVVVEDLEITNAGDFLQDRRGVHVVGTRPGTVRDIVIRRLFIHDVYGADHKDLGGSGGIQVDYPTDGVLIEDNRVQDVNRSGIWVAGTGRPPRPAASRRWPSASTRIVIRRNTVVRVGGDGIVPTGTAGAVVADNVVCCGNLRGRPPIQFDAGIWTFESNGTVIERNEVYGMRNGNADGTGFDIDYNQDGTIVQSNYGHDNAGGFILLCTDTQRRTADVRFNLSVGEYVIDQSQCGATPAQLDGTLGGIRVYNNTFLTPSSLIRHDSAFTLRVLPQAGGFQFVDNIVYATRRQALPFPCGHDCVSNLFFGLPPSGRRAVVGSPRFVDGRRRGTGRLAVGAAFKLRPGSPAIGAGTPVAGGSGTGAAGGTAATANGGTDFFGAPVPATPTIGFFQPR
jgi:hypothetical protein